MEIKDGSLHHQTWVPATVPTLAAKSNQEYQLWCRSYSGCFVGLTGYLNKKGKEGRQSLPQMVLHFLWSKRTKLKFQKNGRAIHFSNFLPSNRLEQESKYRTSNTCSYNWLFSSCPLTSSPTSHQLGGKTHAYTQNPQAYLEYPVVKKWMQARSWIFQSQPPQAFCLTFLLFYSHRVYETQLEITSS